MESGRGDADAASDADLIEAVSEDVDFSSATSLDHGLDRMQTATRRLSTAPCLAVMAPCLCRGAHSG